MTADHSEEIPILSQPLLTEDGFINGACINELESTLNNMPETYDRLAGDPEWSEKRWIFLDDITSRLARWAVAQSPYPCPDDLEVVVKYLAACLEKEFARVPDDDKCTEMVKLSLCQINKLLHDILGEFEPVLKWNNRKNGDDNPTHFVSAYDGETDPDNDFIDLGALFHNVCLSVRNDRRRNDEFERKFEETHGGDDQ